MPFVLPLLGLLDRSGPGGPFPTLDLDPAGPVPDLTRGFAAPDLAHPIPARAHGCPALLRSRTTSRPGTPAPSGAGAAGGA
jgi:hypothetical protein